VRSNLPWRELFLATALGAAGVTSGLAASITISGGTVGMAKLAVPRCTTAAVGVVNNISASNVVSVTISGLPVACGSATIQAAVNNGTSSSSGSGTVPAAGGSVTVTLGAAVAATTTLETDLVLTGP
jgi:hypothetical protein